MLTKAERKRLAKAARELASEFAEERGPELNTFDWCGCAAGLVADGDGNLSFGLDRLTGGALSVATSLETGHSYDGRQIPGAVVFPLLWLADELEAQR